MCFNKIKEWTCKNHPAIIFFIVATIFFIIWNLKFSKTINVIALLAVFISQTYYIIKSLPKEAKFSDKVGLISSSLITPLLFWVAYLALVIGEIQITVAILVLWVFLTIGQLVITSWGNFWNSRTLSRLIVTYIMLSLILVLAFGALFIWFDESATRSTNQWDYLFFSGGNYYSTDLSAYSPSGFYVQILQFMQLMTSSIIHTIIIAVVLGIVLNKDKSENKSEQKNIISATLKKVDVKTRREGKSKRSE